MNKQKKISTKWGYLLLVLALLISTTACPAPAREPEETVVLDGTATVSDLPAYNGEAFAILSDNVPRFSEHKITTDAYEFYSPLDRFGRCGLAEACVGLELMPTEERGSISNIYPSGWDNNPYDFVEGQYVYNRCHLLGYQLTGENANELNLITGTRYMNTEGMLPFENLVADYIKETGNHVMYRVTPIYDGDNLVASGVQMEAYSVEDHGEGVCFHVFCYNVQPGVIIDYATGANHAAGTPTTAPTASAGEIGEFVLNTKSKKIHHPTCGAVDEMSGKNRQKYTGALSALLALGYETCGSCFP